MAGSMNGKVLKEYLNKVIPDDANIRMKNAVEHEDAPPCGTIDEVVCQYSSVGFNLYVDFARDERTYEIVRKYKNDNHPDHNKVIKTGLTRAEAQEHCKDTDSREDGVWFDVFYEE